MIPKITASNHLNSAVLTYAFQYGSQKNLCSLLPNPSPSSCAEMLNSGEVDAALIPSIEYQRIPGLLVSPEVTVASKHKVLSVLLLSQVPIDKISSVSLDTSSRTSASLIQILFSEFYKRNPKFIMASPNISNMLASTDSAILIGDPAITIDRSTLYVYDLVEEWRKFTNHPFVFALWAIRKDSVSKFQNINFVEARDEGLKHLNELVNLYNTQLNIPKEDLSSYVTNNICYNLDEENISGLYLYYELAKKNKLIDSVLPLEWL